MNRYQFKLVFTDGEFRNDWVFAASNADAIHIIANTYIRCDIRSIEIIGVMN